MAEHITVGEVGPRDVLQMSETVAVVTATRRLAAKMVRLIAARDTLHGALLGEVMHGAVARSGLPRLFSRVPSRIAA